MRGLSTAYSSPVLTVKNPSLSQTSSSAVLTRIERAVRCTDGFRLCLVCCDRPELEEQAVVQLLARLRGKRVLDLRLDGPVESLAGVLAARVRPAAPPAAVLVRGWASSLPAEEPAGRQRLEEELDALRAVVPRMLLLWVPRSISRQLERAASRRLGEGVTTYEILSSAEARAAAAPGAEVMAREEAAEEAAARELVGSPPPADQPPTSEILTETAAVEPELEEEEPVERPRKLPVLQTLTPAQKQAEVEHRLCLLQDAVRGDAQNNLESQRRRASLLYELGLLYAGRAEWTSAAAALEESAALFHLVGDRPARGSVLAHLGVTRHHQGKLDDAVGLYDLALQIAREDEDRTTEALILHQHGLAAQARGRLEEALRRFQESLALKRKTGDRRGIAATLHQLGVLRQTQRDLPGAVRLYQESLEIKQKLDDGAGAAATLHQLGTAEHQRGRLDEAMTYYRESLRIKQAAGDRAGTAVTLGQIGRLHQQRGKLRDALQHYATSWSIFRSLESPYAALAQKLIRSIRSQAGEAQFESWLDEDLRGIAGQIRRALDAGPP